MNVFVFNREHFKQKYNAFAINLEDHYRINALRLKFIYFINYL